MSSSDTRMSDALIEYGGRIESLAHSLGLD
jgi:hypothetical protein